MLIIHKGFHLSHVYTFHQFKAGVHKKLRENYIHFLEHEFEIKLIYEDFNIRETKAI